MFDALARLADGNARRMTSKPAHTPMAPKHAHAARKPINPPPKSGDSAAHHKYRPGSYERKSRIGHSPRPTASTPYHR